MDLYVSGSCSLNSVLRGIRPESAAGLSVIDLTNMSFCDASGLVGIACFAERMTEMGMETVLRAPENPNVSNYLARMRLGVVANNLQVVNDLPEVAAYPVDHLLELQPFDGARGAGEIAGLAHRHVHPSNPLAAQALLSGIGETGENVPDHSGRSTGFAAAQKYPKDGRLIFAVGDSGVGMLASLQTEGASNDSEAIRLALTPGGTEYLDKARGNGLPDVVAEVVSLGGSLDVVTGTTQMSATRNGLRTVTTSSYRFQGTLVRGIMHAPV